MRINELLELWRARADTLNKAASLAKKEGKLCEQLSCIAQASAILDCCVELCEQAESINKPGLN